MLPIKDDIPYGLCRCGCGNPTKLAERTSTRKGWIKGQPLRFLPRHFPGVFREENPSWRGGRKINDGGYVIVLQAGHPRADTNGYVREHVLIAEKALGKPLPKGAEVHHVDGNRANNKNSNLVICPNHAYHNLIHLRMKAKKACGNPNWRKCEFCQQWDDPNNMLGKPGRSEMYHAVCRNAYRRQRYAERKSRGGR